MTARRCFTDADAAPAVKGAVHGVLFTVAVTCLVYSVCAWWKRRETHLAVNAVVYTVIPVFEAFQIRSHCQ